MERFPVPPLPRHRTYIAPSVVTMASLQVPPARMITLMVLAQIIHGL